MCTLTNNLVIYSLIFSLKSHCCKKIILLWRYTSDGFQKICIQWNKSVRYIFEHPNNTNRWVLGPLLNQPHISHQLFIRDVKFVYKLIDCHNCIVKECITVGINNSNTILASIDLDLVLML